MIDPPEMLDEGELTTRSNSSASFPRIYKSSFRRMRPFYQEFTGLEVPESMTGLPSPSHSKKGSFGSPRHNQRPKTVWSPGPGQYLIKYRTVVFPKKNV